MSGTLARCGGYELVEDGPRLIFIDRGVHLASELSWFLPFFVLLFTGLALYSAVLMAIEPATRPVRLPGLLVVAALAVSLAVVWFVAIARRARRMRRPWTAFPLVAAVDGSRLLVLGPMGRTIGPLKSVRFRTRVRWTSRSARDLLLVHSGGSLILVRQGAFESLQPVIAALESRGFAVEAS